VDIFLYIHMYIYLHMYMYQDNCSTDFYIYIHLYMYICTYTYIYVYIFVYPCMYIFTHTFPTDFAIHIVRKWPRSQMDIQVKRSCISKYVLSFGNGAITARVVLRSSLVFRLPSPPPPPPPPPSPPPVLTPHLILTCAHMSRHICALP